MTVDKLHPKLAHNIVEFRWRDVESQKRILIQIVIGGLNISEPAADLPSLIAIASSYLDKPVPKGTAVFGEVGLVGEVRAVTGARQRVNEAMRMGFKRCVLPLSCKKDTEQIHGIQLDYVSDIKEALKKTLSQN